MTRIKFLVLSLCLLSAPGLLAQQLQEEEVMSAGELLKACQEEAAASFCNTFIVTLVQTVTALQEAGQGPQLFCIDPQVISLEQVRNTIVTRLQKLPERGGEEAYTLVSEILHQSYPCGATSF